MFTYPTSESLGLVAIMPSPKDMEIARLLGWYRIPLRTAPKVVDVDFLAFYQTDAFGEDHRWRIEYFAPVRGHELTTRAQLFRDERDHPRANEEYYKIQLGSLKRLKKAILADRWKRVTFLYTTGELFQKAVLINDLVVGSDDRKILWRSLRERASRSEYYNAEEFTEESLELDPGLLRFIGTLGDPFFSDQDDAELES